MEWTTLSSIVMPATLYSTEPRTKNDKYIKVIVFAVFLMFGFTLSTCPSASYSSASSLPLKKRSIIMTKPNPPMYWSIALYKRRVFGSFSTSRILRPVVVRPLIDSKREPMNEAFPLKKKGNAKTKNP